MEGMLQIGKGAPSKVRLEVGRRIYFMASELLMPAARGPTEEEERDS